MMKSIILTIILLSMSLAHADEDLDPLIFSGYDFTTNKVFNFNQFKGKIVYIDFWASWCAPCIESMPFMEKLYKQYAAQGFEIIAVNIDEHKEDATKFLTQYPISYLNLYDPEGDIGMKFNVRQMPTAFLVDTEGKLLYKHVGYNKKYADKLSNILEKLLKK